MLRTIFLRYVEWPNTLELRRAEHTLRQPPASRKGLMRSMKPAVAKRRRVSRANAERRHRARVRLYARWRPGNVHDLAWRDACRASIASGVTGGSKGDVSEPTFAGTSAIMPLLKMSITSVI